jgi:hypothetical protein
MKNNGLDSSVVVVVLEQEQHDHHAWSCQANVLFLLAPEEKKKDGILVEKEEEKEKKNWSKCHGAFRASPGARGRLKSLPGYLQPSRSPPSPRGDFD